MSVTVGAGYTCGFCGDRAHVKEEPQEWGAKARDHWQPPPGWSLLHLPDGKFKLICARHVVMVADTLSVITPGDAANNLHTTTHEWHRA